MTQPSATHYLILPGPEAWEAYKASPGTSAHPVTLEAVEASPLPRRIGLPIRWTFSLFTRTQATDATALRGALSLQLEKLGLPTEVGDFAHRSVGRSEAGGGIHLFALPDAKRQRNLPLPDLVGQDAGPAWQCFPWNDTGLYVFRELGRWVALWIRDAVPAATRDLALHDLVPYGASALRQTILQWQSSGAMDDAIQPVPVVLCDPAPPEFLAAATEMGLAVRSAPRPLPQMPAEWISLQPVRLRSALAAASRRSRRRRAVALALLVVSLLLAATAAFWFVTNRRVSKLRTELARITPRALALQEAEAAWLRVEPAVEPGLGPLESLLRPTQLLPADGLRITKFEQSGRSVAFSGEGTNAAQIFAWVKALKEDPTCAHIQWNDPSVKMLPGNLTQFTLQGSLLHAPAQ